MTNANSTSEKRRLLGVGILSAIIATCSFAEAQTFIVHGKDKNGGEVCEPLKPVEMNKSDDEFYDYQPDPIDPAKGSSQLHFPYAECKTTTMSLFQQNGSKYLSLIVVHNSFKNPCEDDGRQAASFTFDVLQPFKNVIRLDDENDAHIFAGKKDRGDEAPLEKAVWDWDLKRTDGMVLRLSDDPSTGTFGVTITPEYNPAQDWTLRFYKPKTNSYVELSLSEPFTITNKKAVELTPDVSLLPFDDVECKSQRPNQSKTITIRNTGACILKITGVNITPSSFFEVSQGQSFPIEIAPNSAGQLSIDFKPQSVNIPNNGIPPEGLTIEGRLNFISNAIDSPPVMLRAKIVDIQKPQLTSDCPSEPFIFDAMLDEDNQVGKLITANDLQLSATDDCIAQPNLIQFVGTIMENGMPTEEFTFPHFFTPGTRAVRVHAKDRAENRSTEFCDFIITVDTEPVIDLNPLRVVFEIECDKSSERGFTEEVIIRNAGTATLTLSEVKLLSANSRFALMNRPAPGTTLAPGQSLQPPLGIVFTGGNSRDTFTDNLQILSNNQGVPNSQRLLPITAIVDDEVAPFFTAFPPKLMQVCATGRNVTPVSFTVTAEDNCDTDPDITVVCTPPSGSIFPNGQKTRVNCKAMDSKGNFVEDFFEVEVLVGGKITLKPSPAKFDTTECGKTSKLSILLKNTGICPDTIKNVMVSGPFSLLRTLPPDTIINPKDSTILRVQFMPTRTGTFDKDSLVIISGSMQRRTRDTLNAVSRDTKPPTIVCRQDTIGCVDDPSKKLKINITATAFDSCSGLIDPNNIVYTITKFNGEMRSERIRPPTHNFPIGTTEVTCTATDAAGNDSSCAFTIEVVHFQSTITILQPEAADSVTCADRTSFTAQATTNINAAQFFILEASFIIRGNKTIRVNVGDTTIISNGFFSIPPESLHVGQNLIEAFVRVKDKASKCRAEARAQFRITRFIPNVGKIIINEILSDPNVVPKPFRVFADDDFDGGAGHERIELKNVSNGAISLRGMGLWIQRIESGKTLNTVVHFSNRQLKKDGYLDIHYLANGDSDEVNFFTGLPQPGHTDSADASDGFSGDNSADPKKMLLGGLNNAHAFAIALVDSIHLGLPETLLLSSCRMLDFVQIGGDVESVRSIAAQQSVVVPRGLWPNEARFIPSAPAGSSYEFKEDSAKVLVTTPDHFVDQCLHSLGLPNKIDQPQANHLLITEVAVRPNFLQFIEIFNPQPKDSKPIALANYYLTNDGDAMPLVGMTPRNSYTTIVKGKNNLEVGDSDFVVRFPKTDSIKGQTYLTIALASSDTSSFFERYQNEPDYEIFFKNMPGMMNDRTVTDMDTVKAGKGPIKLRESDDVVVLFNWDGVSPLVKDVDYVRWGKREAVNKTDLIIDGRAYAADTPADQQKVIDSTNGHQLLKSWQRRQRPREFGEPSACDELDPSIPTNGLAGHNETSENLAEAFQQAKPTPGEASGKLDLDFRIISDLRRPNGERNDKINPDETIQIKVRLKNLSDNPTGPLIGTLRIADDTTKKFIVTGVISDSVAAFPPIPAGQAAYSDTSYVFSTKAISLPDSLRFKLFVIEKPSLAKSGLESERLAVVGGEEVDMVVATNNVALKLIDYEPVLISEPNRTILQLRHRLKHILNLVDPQTGRPTGALKANSIKASVTIFDPTLINTSITRTIRYKKDLDPQATTSVPDTFKLVTNKPFFGNETPKILLEYSWSEIAGDSLEPPTDTVFVRWPTRDTFKIRGVVTYFNQADKPVKGATVQLENNGVFKDTSTTDGSGNFVFSDLGRRDVGNYRLTVTHFGRPIGAIRKNDSTEVRSRFDYTLHSPAPANVTEVFQRIAADVTGDRIINRADSAAVVDKVRNPNSCQAFPVGKDWTFVDMDALGRTNLSNSFQIPESISFRLQNYNFENLRFAGVVYGDVDGSARFDTGTVPCSTAALISGVVTYFPVEKEVRGGQPAPQPTKFVGNVVVTIDGGKFAVATTDSNGRYEFRNLPIDLSYRIKLAKTDSFTIKRLNRYINFDDTPFLINERTRSELEGWQKIAADVYKLNMDPDFPVTAIVLNDTDKVRLVNFLNPPSSIIGLTGQWRFRQCSIMNLSPSDPGCDMRFPMFDPRRAIQDTIVAVLLGDIDGSWPSEGGERGGIAKAGEKFLNYSFLQELEVTPGDSFTLPLRMEPAQEIAAAKLNLQFEAKHLEVVSITKGKALKDYLLQDDIKPGHIQATLSSKASETRASEIFLITFRVIGKVGESSLLELKEFSVDETAMTATGRVRLVKRIPKEHFLSQNYPNPFNPSTTIEYGLPHDEQVRLQIFNVIGQVVSIIVDERQEAGYYHLNWNGQDANGRSLPAGVYFMRLQAGKFSKVRKLALVK